MAAIDVDASQVKARLPKLENNIKRGVPKALEDIAYEVLRLSQKEVPHDEGTLQNTGTVEEIFGEIVLGYHTPYAARLHEHPEYRFKKGRKGKYLEDPIKRNERQLNFKFGQKFQQELEF